MSKTPSRPSSPERNKKTDELKEATKKFLSTLCVKLKQSATRTKILHKLTLKRPFLQD